MAGRRSLTDLEERKLLRIVRRLPPRGRAMISTLWLTGFRISQVRSRPVQPVDRDGLVNKIGGTPRHQKGRRGKQPRASPCPLAGRQSRRGIRARRRRTSRRHQIAMRHTSPDFQISHAPDARSRVDPGGDFSTEWGERALKIACRLPVFAGFCLPCAKTSNRVVGCSGVLEDAH
jgi:integrase